MYALLAELELLRGDLRAAQADVDAGLAEVHGSGQGLGHLDLLWVQARIHRERSEVVPGEACFRRMFELARSRGAWLYALRAANDLARLLAAQGRRDEPRRMLEEALAALPDRAGCADALAGDALLAELRAGEGP